MILLIGCGYWGKNWYKTLQSSPYKLAGVVDPNPVIEVSCPLFKDLSEVNIPFTHAIVATNAVSHLDIVNKLQSIPKRNILVEKPCGFLEQRHNFLECFPGFIFLSSPHYKLIKSMLDNKMLGKVLYSTFKRASMGPRLREDVNIVEDYLIHDLYLYCSLFGYSDSVQATGHLLKSFKDPILEDTVFLTVQNKEHTASFFSSWNYPRKERLIEIVGTEGSLIWDNDQLCFTRSYYNEINGKDKYRNTGYELIEKELIDISPSLSKSNLELELIDFMNYQPRTQIYIDTVNLIWKIKKEIIY